MKQIKYILIIPIVLLLSACSKKETPILTYEQNLTEFTQDISTMDNNISGFEQNYFMPWNISQIAYSPEKATWANQVFSRKGKYYGENTLPLDEKEVNTIIQNTNFENYNSINKFAITIKGTQVRNLPTHKPFMKNTQSAGEGFSFDYLQNTRLHVNEPLFISHYSKDKAWAFVQNSVSTGWIPSESFVYLDAQQRREFQNSQKLIAVQDNIPIYDVKERFITYVKLGSLFPFLNATDERYLSFMYVKNYDGTAKKIYILLPIAQAKTFPIPFDSLHVKEIASELLNEKYGWGGFMANRDCSAMTKDFFAPFGIWLPRNSFAQSQTGEYISLENLKDEEKEKLIAQVGIPFVSLIYLKGHIMLYIGQKDSKAMVMHNTWGLKIGEGDEEKRLVIGRSIISDLYLGSNQKDIVEESILIKKVKGIVVKPQTKVKKTHPLVKAYKQITKISDNLVYFDDNTTLIYDDMQEKSFEQMLENADIEDMFSLNYKAFEEILPPLDDAGRVRNDALLKKLYGANEQEIKDNLIELIWIDGTKISFNKRQNAALQLQKIISELSEFPKEYTPYITNIGGTYNYRHIAGTSRLSAHSFGIAIDLNVAKSAYWRWDKNHTYKNNFPKEIIDIFEKYGFIWGGRWYHYDTMHFEYRPELFEYVD
jgi:hypothetical protein